MHKLGVPSRGVLRGILADWSFVNWLGIEPEDISGYSQSYLLYPVLRN